MILKYLIEKEFKLIIRNKFMPRLIVIWPIMMMVLLPFAANFEIYHLRLSIVDHDQSPYSHRLTGKIAGSSYFSTPLHCASYSEALENIEDNRSDILIEIPKDFQRDLVSNSYAQVLIAANAVNGTKGGLGSSYLAAIVMNFSGDISVENRSVSTSSSASSSITSPSSAIVNIVTENKYNPYMDYRQFMVPALMVMLLTLLCGFMPTFNIVSEKELGTIEQMNVSPVNKDTFILSKLIPYWIMGISILTVSMGIAWLIYGMLPVGNWGIVYVGAAIFIVVMSAMGLIISSYSQTIQQSMFVMFFFLLILLLLSGLFTPISSMPEWAQWITVFNPLTYFVQIMRGVYLKASTFADLSVQFYALSAFAVGMSTWAVLSYTKGDHSR